MKVLYSFLFISIASCQSQENVSNNSDSLVSPNQKEDRINAYYLENEGTNLPSEAIGSVSQGSLKNGKLVPFNGPNYHYFDTLSYLSGRAFVHDKLKATLIKTYKELESAHPDHHFCLMECSNKEGGKIHPHRTHQNGLSVDFMSPLQKNGEPYYGLDSLGAEHYLLSFDAKGRYAEDTSISINFEVLAQHLLILESQAREQGLKISKVIFKMELKDELYSSKYGEKLKQSSIYITKNLSPLINALHDDHYHVDFELIK